MSVAVEFAPSVPLPYPLREGIDPAGATPAATRSLALVGGPDTASGHRPRGARHPLGLADTGPGAGVSVLRAPNEASMAPPVQLTGRGVVVVALGVLALCVALVWGAAASVAGAGSGVGVSSGGPAVVTVRAGDTLWSIAARVSPDRDPRSEVVLLQRINHVSGAELAALVPGQRLRVR